MIRQRLDEMAQAGIGSGVRGQGTVKLIEGKLIEGKLIKGKLIEAKFIGGKPIEVKLIGRKLIEEKLIERKLMRQVRIPPCTCSTFLVDLHFCTEGNCKLVLNHCFALSFALSFETDPPKWAETNLSSRAR